MRRSLRARGGEERSLLRGAIVEDVAGERGGGCAGELKRRETCGWDADGT